MNKLRLLAAMIVMAGAFAFAWASLASAHSFRTGTNVTTGQGEKINETLFASGRTVDISSEVFGDIFCAGQTVTVTGTVHGDVICAGQTVNVTGKVDGDVRLAGQNVTVGADIGGNATIAGQTFNLESTGSVKGDITLGSTDATINGTVGRDIAAGSDNLIIASTVGGDIKGTTNKLTLSRSAKIAGDINYTSKNELNREDGAVITGKVARTQPARPSSSKHGAIFGFGVGWFVYWFMSMLLTAMVLVLLFPSMFQAVSNRAMPTPWKALLTGFLANIAVPVVMVLFAITVIGLPLTFITLFLWFLVVLLSGPLFGYYIGRLILRDSRQPLLIMLVGASVLLVLYFLPVLGLLSLLAAMWIGAGMLLLEVFSRTPKPAYNLAQTAAKSGRKS